MRKVITNFKKWWCAFNNHPYHRVFSGPFNGLWTLYCPVCDKYWDEIIDGVLPRDDELDVKYLIELDDYDK